MRAWRSIGIGRDIRKDGEAFADELEKMPRGWSRPASKRVWEICMMIDMIFLTKHYETADEVIKRYPIGERGRWKYWDKEIDSVPWLKPVSRPTANQ